MLGKYSFGLGEPVADPNYLYTPAPISPITTDLDYPTSSLFQPTPTQQNPIDSILSTDEIAIPRENQTGAGGSLVSPGYETIMKWAIIAGLGLAGIIAYKTFSTKKTIIDKIIDIIPGTTGKKAKKKLKSAKKSYKKKTKSGSRKAKKAKAAVATMRSGATQMKSGARSLKRLAPKRRKKVTA